MKTMKRSGKTFVLALSAVLFGQAAGAVSADSSPYRGIVERNIFNVHAAPPVAAVDPQSLLPPPPNVKLQGITDILGRKQVLFKVQLPAKPGAAGKEESYILTVGERQGEIEILDINPKAGTVRMRNYGVETNLSLELNSDKLVNTAPVAPPPGQPNPGTMAAPGTLAPPPAMPGLPPGKFPRTLRLPGTNPGNPGGTPDSSSLNNYGGANYANNAQAQQQADTDHLTQVANLAVQKRLAEQSKDRRVQAMAPIIPMPAELQGEMDGNNNQPNNTPQLPPGF